MIFVKFLRTLFFVEHLCMTASAAFENISCFFKEREAAFERYREKCATASKKKICAAHIFCD